MLEILIVVGYFIVGLFCATGLLAWVNKTSFIDNDDRFMAGLTVFAWPLFVIVAIICIGLKKFFAFVESKF